MLSITLTKSQRKNLEIHAERGKPNETCALLLGIVNGVESQTKEIFFTENVEHSPNKFTISADQLIKGYKRAEENKMDIVGIFHSHPNSEPFPSLLDKKFMFSNPVVWVIYSGISKKFKAYVLKSDILEIEIIVE